MWVWLENDKNKNAKGLFHTTLSSYVQKVGFFQQFASVAGNLEEEWSRVSLREGAPA